MSYANFSYGSCEVSNPGLLLAHLMEGCEDMFTPVEVVDEDHNHLGYQTRYDFDDFRDVIWTEYSDGCGEIKVLGDAKGLEIKLNNLKRIIGFKDLNLK